MSLRRERCRDLLAIQQISRYSRVSFIYIACLLINHNRLYNLYGKWYLRTSDAWFRSAIYHETDRLLWLWYVARSNVDFAVSVCMHSPSMLLLSMLISMPLLSILIFIHPLSMLLISLLLLSMLVSMLLLSMLISMLVFSLLICVHSLFMLLLSMLMFTCSISMLISCYCNSCFYLTINHTPVICFIKRKLTVKQEETDCSVALRSCGGRLEICICHNKVIMFTQCSGLARLLWDFKKLPFFALFHLLLTGRSPF